MDEDEELFREMNEEDDFYMGEDYGDRDKYTPNYNIHYNNGNLKHTGKGGMGCLVMLPLLTGMLTYVLLFII